MARSAIITGSLLTLLGVAGYVIGMMDGKASWTAFIPAFAGVPILFCGIMAQKPECRMHAMHGAALFALLGFLAPLGRLIPTAVRNGVTFNAATLSMVAMAVICGVFLVLCVRSFIQARQARQTS